jgi:protein arginine kinase
VVIDDIVKDPGTWLSSGGESGIVISSRIRLARNIKGFRFPGWASLEERRRLYRTVCEACSGVDVLSKAVTFDMAKLAVQEKDVLRERHLISNELAAQDVGSGLVLADDEGIAIMVNEEDHLRLQAVSAGMHLHESWVKLDAMDSELEAFFDYAFSEKVGYLSACPTNVGTGLRASVMLHLSGLKLMGELEATMNGLSRMGFAVRGLLGEGTEAHGNMFQISNQSTMGQTEREIIDQLTTVVEEVVHHECNARKRAMQRKESSVFDLVCRSLGILMNARILTSGEAIERLSAIRMGVELGIVKNLSIGSINEIMLLTQPGHLQRQAGKELSPSERDEMRARIVTDKLTSAVVGDSNGNE